MTPPCWYFLRNHSLKIGLQPSVAEKNARLQNFSSLQLIRKSVSWRCEYRIPLPSGDSMKGRGELPSAFLFLCFTIYLQLVLTVTSCSSSILFLRNILCSAPIDLVTQLESVIYSSNRLFKQQQIFLRSPRNAPEHRLSARTTQRLMFCTVSRPHNAAQIGAQPFTSRMAFRTVRIRFAVALRA